MVLKHTTSPKVYYMPNKYRMLHQKANKQLTEHERAWWLMITLLRDQSQLTWLIICKNQNNAYDKTGHPQNLGHMKPIASS